MGFEGSKAYTQGRGYLPIITRSKDGDAYPTDIIEVDQYSAVNTNLLSMGKLCKQGYHFSINASDPYMQAPNGPKISLHFDIDNVLHLPHTTRQGKDAHKLPTAGEWTKVAAGPNAKPVQHVIDFGTSNRFTALQ